MKKIFTLLFIAVSLFSANAQPTITTSALPKAGITYHTISADAVSYPLLSNMLLGAANFNWNCSTLITPFDTTHMSFVAASSTPYANLFASSNLATNSATDSIYTYIHTNSNGLYADGLYSYSAGLVSGDGHYSAPGQLLIPTPFTMGNTSVSSAVFTADKTIALIFHAGIYRTETRNSIADGWGTIITPMDTFTNVLRIKTKITSYDSIYLPAIIGPSPAPSYDTSYEYMWVQNVDSIGQIMTINTTKDSTTITDVTYNYKYRKTINGIASVNNSRFNIFPNPTSSELQIATSNHEPYTFVIFNILGEQQQVGKAIGNTKISVSNLSNGNYFIQINQNNKIINQHFVVKD
jgi:hypothetical protein